MDYISAFWWERRPRREGDLQTTTHRPEGGAPTLIAALIAMPKISNTSVTMKSQSGKPSKARKKALAVNKKGKST